MNRLRFFVAVLFGKLVFRLSKMLGYKGSSLPGMVALKIYPGFLSQISKKLDRRIVLVTGTNGKTTTNNIIASIMRASGYKIVCNAEGANMINGIAAAFILAADFKGNLNHDYAVLEVDEASFPHVTKYLNPEFVVINNFFRDQLDRYGELDKTILFIKDAVKKLEDTVLIANADDPLVMRITAFSKHKTVYYGVLTKSEEQFVKAKETKEARFCPVCGSKLIYDFYHYSQLGDYKCEGCGFKRPDLGICAFEVKLLDGGICSKVCDRIHKMEFEIKLNIKGFYNIYNALAACTFSRLKAIDVPIIQKALFEYKPVAGRLEVFYNDEKEILLNLVKNPTGFNEGIKTLGSIEKTKDVFIAINDNHADGIDISWLWDVDFEFLADRGDVLSFICSGKRSEEMALRLKYAGVPVEKIKIIKNMREAVAVVVNEKAKNAYLFATYTALWPVQRYLKAILKSSEKEQRACKACKMK
ncbi:MurT ligase domain-containing protein [Peptococcaceae bacterium]|nr:MurT ligase domain-containing protein [Peptococcaceae bacterium]